MNCQGSWHRIETGLRTQIRKSATEPNENKGVLKSNRWGAHFYLHPSSSLTSQLAVIITTPTALPTRVLPPLQTTGCLGSSALCPASHPMHMRLCSKMAMPGWHRVLPSVAPMLFSHHPQGNGVHISTRKHVTRHMTLNSNIAQSGWWGRTHN